MQQEQAVRLGVNISVPVSPFSNTLLKIAQRKEDPGRHDNGIDSSAAGLELNTSAVYTTKPSGEYKFLELS